MSALAMHTQRSTRAGGAIKNTYVVESKVLEPLQCFPNGQVKVLVTMVVNNKIVTRVTSEAAISKYPRKSLDDKAIRKEEREARRRGRELAVHLMEQEKRERVVAWDEAGKLERGDSGAIAELEEDERTRRFDHMFKPLEGENDKTPGLVLVDQLERDERERRTSIEQEVQAENVLERRRSADAAGKLAIEELQRRLRDESAFAEDEARARAQSLESASALERDERTARLGEHEVARDESTRARRASIELARALADELVRTSAVERHSHEKELLESIGEEVEQVVALQAEEQQRRLVPYQEAAAESKALRLAALDEARAMTDQELQERLLVFKEAEAEIGRLRRDSMSSASSMLQEEQERRIQEDRHWLDQQAQEQKLARQMAAEIWQAELDSQLQFRDEARQSSEQMRQEGVAMAKAREDEELQRRLDNPDEERASESMRVMLGNSVGNYFRKLRDPKRTAVARKVFYDYDKSDGDTDALMWLTHLENALHAYDPEFHPLDVKDILEAYVVNEEGSIRYREFLKIIDCLEQPNFEKAFRHLKPTIEVILPEERQRHKPEEEESARQFAIVPRFESTALKEGRPSLIKTIPEDNEAEHDEIPEVNPVKPKLRRSPSEIASQCRGAFHKHDSDRDGRLTTAQTRAALIDLGYIDPVALDEGLEPYVSQGADRLISFQEFNRITGVLDELTKQIEAEQLRQLAVEEAHNKRRVFFTFANEDGIVTKERIPHLFAAVGFSDDPRVGVVLREHHQRPEFVGLNISQFNKAIAIIEELPEDAEALKEKECVEFGEQAAQEWFKGALVSVATHHRAQFQDVIAEEDRQMANAIRQKEHEERVRLQAKTLAQFEVDRLQAEVLESLKDRSRAHLCRGIVTSASTAAFAEAVRILRIRELNSAFAEFAVDGDMDRKNFDKFVRHTDFNITIMQKNVLFADGTASWEEFARQFDLYETPPKKAPRRQSSLANLRKRSSAAEVRGGVQATIPEQGPAADAGVVDVPRQALARSDSKGGRRGSQERSAEARAKPAGRQSVGSASRPVAAKGGSRRSVGANDAPAQAAKAGGRRSVGEKDAPAAAAAAASKGASKPGSRRSVGQGAAPAKPASRGSVGGQSKPNPAAAKSASRRSTGQKPR